MKKIGISLLLISTLTFASFPANAQAATRADMLLQIELLTKLVSLLQAQLLARQSTEGLTIAYTNGKDASIKQSLSNVRSLAEISYNENNFSYSNVCINASSNRIVSLLDSAKSKLPSTTKPTNFSLGISSTNNEITCHATAENYAVISPLNLDTAYCVDSAGFAGIVAADAITANDLTCSK